MALDVRDSVRCHFDGQGNALRPLGRSVHPFATHRNRDTRSLESDDHSGQVTTARNINRELLDLDACPRAAAGIAERLGRGGCSAGCARRERRRQDEQAGLGTATSWPCLHPLPYKSMLGSLTVSPSTERAPRRHRPKTGGLQAQKQKNTANLKGHGVLDVLQDHNGGQATKR